MKFILQISVVVTAIAGLLLLNIELFKFFTEGQMDSFVVYAGAILLLDAMGLSTFVKKEA